MLLLFCIFVKFLICSGILILFHNDLTFDTITDEYDSYFFVIIDDNKNGAICSKMGAGGGGGGVKRNIAFFVRMCTFCYGFCFLFIFFYIFDMTILEL